MLACRQTISAPSRDPAEVGRELLVGVEKNVQHCSPPIPDAPIDPLGSTHLSPFGSHYRVDNPLPIVFKTQRTCCKAQTVGNAAHVFFVNTDKIIWSLHCKQATCGSDAFNKTPGSASSSRPAAASGPAGARQSDGTRRRHSRHHAARCHRPPAGGSAAAPGVAALSMTSTQSH